MALIYIGKDGNRRVNGRKLEHGEAITDPQEVKDLTGHPDFEDKYGGIVIDNPPAADKPEDEEE